MTFWDDEPIPARELLRLMAGDLCPCGHETQDHEPPDPDFNVGDFKSIRGACNIEGCPCKGVIE